MDSLWARKSLKPDEDPKRRTEWKEAFTERPKKVRFLPYFKLTVRGVQLTSNLFVFVLPKKCLLLFFFFLADSFETRVSRHLAEFRALHGK